MTRLGYVFGNLMVNVHLKNKKLVERGIGIVQKATGADRDQAIAALKAAKQQVPVAILILKANLSATEATRRLKKANGHLRLALNQK
jgi:N-acetylmuramic acid 6-phosphate etherase